MAIATPQPAADFPLALDLAGLFLAPLNRTPRGIDRVELAYARHFLGNWDGECVAVLPAPWGVRFFERERALRFLAAVEELWREDIDPDQDAVYAWTKARILNHDRAEDSPVSKRRLSKLKILGRYFFMIRAAGFSFGRSVRKHLPENAVYLNVGQVQVMSRWFRWLERRKDVVAVFMVHDVTPIEHPGYHRPFIVRMHHRIVRNTARYAQALIFPSVAAQNSVLAELKKHSAREFPSHVELLPVPEAFLNDVEHDRQLHDANFFLICGAIDPHKNHVLLLKVWQQLICKYGAQTPYLVIAGSPQEASNEFLSMIQTDAALRSHVMLAAGLSTPALRKLMISAIALLMPSKSEGFGLPIVEALAQGTAVIASDIPAHREAGENGDVRYLPADDVNAWVEEVSSRANGKKADQAERKAAYAPKRWPDYFRGIKTYLRTLKYAPRATARSRDHF